ncbi:hypothetical protein CRG98_023962, partial [Punica granatum]
KGKFGGTLLSGRIGIRDWKWAVKVFRQGFQRMEKMMIEMVKEIGPIQREMEMKRAAMI